MSHRADTVGLWPRTVLLGVAALTAALATAAPNSKVYRWTDDKGVVHYGDSVPAQAAGAAQTVLNHQGIAVGVINPPATDEAAEATARQHAAEQQARDRYLLATYLSAAEIESLRDRRLEILEGQARAIGQYVDQLSGHASQLEALMRHFEPYAATHAPPLPDRLAEDAVHTVHDLTAQQAMLASKRAEIERTRTTFEDDLARFRELKASGHSGR